MFPLQTLRLYPFLKLAIALILGMWLATGVDILAFTAIPVIALFRILIGRGIDDSAIGGHRQRLCC